MDVSKITLNDVMLHSVPKADLKHKAEHPPELTDVAAPLDTRMQAFLDEKLKKALRNHARPITEDVSIKAKAAQEIRDYLLADEAARDLVATSKQLASWLHLEQPGVAPQGIVLVADLDWAGGPGLLLAKLDRETGMRTGTFTKDAQGRTVPTVQYLDDLFVTDGTKVFKIAIFPASGIKGGRLSGQIVDVQVRGHEAAHYFLNDYLGCNFSQRAEEVTELFSDAATAIINSTTIPDAEKRARYTVALSAELQSQSKDLNVTSFALNHLDPEDRSAFIAEMQSKGVPAGPIKKNTALIESRLKRVQIETAHDVFIMAPPSRLEDGTVTVQPTSTGEPDTVTINDEVRRVTNRS